MGRRGPTPKNLKVLHARGSYIRPHRRGDGKLAPMLLKPPTFVSDEGKTHWKTLAKTLYEAGISTPLDTIALCVLIELLVQYISLGKVVEAEGAVSPGHRDVERSSPAYRLWLQTGELLMKHCREFFLTPKSREGVVLTPSQSGDDSKARFFQDTDRFLAE